MSNDLQAIRLFKVLKKRNLWRNRTEYHAIAAFVGMALATDIMMVVLDLSPTMMIVLDMYPPRFTSLSCWRFNSLSCWWFIPIVIVGFIGGYIGAQLGDYAADYRVFVKVLTRKSHNDRILFVESLLNTLVGDDRARFKDTFGAAATEEKRVKWVEHHKDVILSCLDSFSPSGDYWPHSRK